MSKPPPKPEELAYAAGLIDGEGCIFAHVPSRKRQWVRVSLQVAMTDPVAVEWLASLFGGRVRWAKGATARCKPQARWCVCDKRAGAALTALLPYLRVKRAQAECALSLLRLSPGRGRSVSPRAAVEASGLRASLRLLNRKGVA